MALVSYVDILEVVGELKDFKAKLVEGESIAQSGGIAEFSVKDRGKGVLDLSAVCQLEHASHIISISIISEPRILDCKCSCLDGKTGKCQHVVATLIHIHRNNISIDSFNHAVRLESSTKGMGGCLTSPSPETITPESYEANNINPTFPSTESGFQECINAKAAQNDIPIANHLLESVEISDLVPSNQEVPMDVDTNIASEDADGNETEINSNATKRMGRGHRKSVPNPKYASESKQYTCPVCSKILGKKTHYEAHVRSHTGEKPFVCDICGQGYSQKRTLLKHKEMNPGGECRAAVTLKCHPCDSVFKTQSEMDNHLLSHFHKCRDCNKSFPQKQDLEVHQCMPVQHAPDSIECEQRDKDKNFVCDACGKEFDTSSELAQHKMTHTGDKNFKCLECGKCFSRERTFKAHKHTQKGDASSEKLAPKKRVVITCKTCGKEFTNRVHHEEHVRSHTGERPFQCVECGKGFATKRSLRNHSHGEKDSRDRLHSCHQCPASFATAFMLKVHEKSHSDERPFTCAECGKSYRSQHVYQDHLNQHKGIKAYSCKECGKSFTWRTSLWAHTANHAKEKPFGCVQCGAMFAEQSQLKDHWEVHLDDKPFQCPICGLGFMLQPDCDKHIEIHKQSPSYSCTKCDEKFVWADELNRHLQTHKEKRKFLCPTCGQTFANKGHLKVHLMIHTGEKPFECETCHKRFYTRSLLRKHTVFHSNERPFECALCSYKFPTQGILRAHIRIHTGEKPFTCDLCGKAFPQSSYLKRHMLIHSKDKPFPCPHCDSSFVTKYDLKVHVRIHTGDRPYSCHECNEQFFENSQLTAHLRTHSGKKPFVCDLCGKGFNSSYLMKKHFGRVHSDVAPFYCVDCEERFVSFEALRKHRRSTHISDSDDQVRQEEATADVVVPSEVEKDPLNRLIEDSEILVEETSSTSSDVVTEVAPVLTQGYEIVQVNLVDSSELIQLPEGYSCETVEVYHAESLSGFEGNGEFQTVSITTVSDEIDVTHDVSTNLET